VEKKERLFADAALQQKKELLIGKKPNFSVFFRKVGQKTSYLVEDNWKKSSPKSVLF